MKPNLNSFFKIIIISPVKMQSYILIIFWNAQHCKAELTRVWTTQMSVTDKHASLEKNKKKSKSRQMNWTIDVLEIFCLLWLKFLVFAKLRRMTGKCFIITITNAKQEINIMMSIISHEINIVVCIDKS